MGILVPVGIGVGLASVSGIRAFLPFAIVMIFAMAGMFEVPDSLQQTQSLRVIGGLVALAVLEILLDKRKSLEPGLDVILTPIRAIVGALLFAVAFSISPAAPSVPSVVPLLVAGGVIAGVIAIFKIFSRPSARGQSSGASHAFLSFCEDVVALAGGILAVFVPFVSLILVIFLLFFFRRIRKRRGRKFGGLRILGD